MAGISDDFAEALCHPVSFTLQALQEKFTRPAQHAANLSGLIS
jgi:hypothetical protein